MININALNFAKRAIGKTKLLWNAHGSDILVYGGCVGVVVGVVLACVETTKVESIVDETKAKVDEIKTDIPEDGKPDKETSSKLAKTYVKGVAKIAANYAPSAAVIVISEAFIFQGHRIIKKKNAALTAAFAALSEAFKRYRTRVEAELGSEKERELYYGADTIKKVVATEAESAEAKKVFNGSGLSPYARYFDAGETDDDGNIVHPNYLFQSNPFLNLIRIKSVQEEMNHRLHAYGHVFLREVYEALGFRVEDCQVANYVGWVDNGRGDNTIDFHLYDCNIPQNVAFINGRTPIALLDFNVDGNIEFIYESWFGKDTAKKLIGNRDKVRRK